MREFYLIDLVQQAPAIQMMQLSWTYEQLLSWLHVYGEVDQDPDDARRFHFREWWRMSQGYFDQYRYEENGSLWWYADHHRVLLWPPVSTSTSRHT